MLLADGLVPDTVSAAHRFLKQVLDHAEDVGDIEKNPITRAVKPPKRQRREPNGLDDESRRHLMTLVDEMDDTPLTLAIRLGLTAGLRNEEAVGLKWQHIDFAAGIMEAEATRQREGFLEDDPRVEAVNEYLCSNRDHPVCTRELADRALHVEPTAKLYKELSAILTDQCPGWRYDGKRCCGLYNKQRCWVYRPE